MFHSFLHSTTPCGTSRFPLCSPFAGHFHDGDARAAAGRGGVWCLAGEQKSLAASSTEITWCWELKKPEIQWNPKSSFCYCLKVVAPDISQSHPASPILEHCLAESMSLSTLRFLSIPRHRKNGNGVPNLLRYGKLRTQI